MKLALPLLLLAALFVVSNCNNISAVTRDGFDVIYLDHPGFVHTFSYDWVTNQFYAFGEATFRQINHNQNVFMVVDNATLLPFNQPFIDVRLFSQEGKGDLWAIGPTYAGPQTALNIGFFLPIAAIGPGFNDLLSYQGDKRGYTFYAVSVDSRNFSHVRAYFVGWSSYRPGIPSTNNDSVHLVVVRARINLTGPPVTRNFHWSEGNATHPSEDIAPLYTDDFHPYHSTNKPRVIHDGIRNRLYVVDPGTSKIYSVNAPNSTDWIDPITTGGTFDFSSYGSILAGSTWHYYNDILYLAFAGRGFENGTLIAVNLVSLTLEKQPYKFPAYFSNPRAIAGQNRTLYIGFEGGPTILKFDVILWQIVGHQRLPDYLSQVYSAFDSGFDHVYFATYEQHSKIFRIHKEDFCSSECPYNGYCQSGVCHCNQGYQITANKRTCEVTPRIIDNPVKDTAAAAALGVLFAISFVVGAIGWIMFYRKSKGYERVL